MIVSYMPKERTYQLLLSQRASAANELESLDSGWVHSRIIRMYLIELISMIDEMLKSFPNQKKAEGFIYDRKRDKYTHWAEVLRLSLFQYERYACGGNALTEGLYASLLMSAAIWQVKHPRKITILGCGPGRSALDFSRLYPASEIIGLDYSLLALLLAEKIVCGNDTVPLLRRDVLSSEYSEVLNIPGMNRKNVKFGLIDLGMDEIPKSDMIVCSNVINLLPNHKEAIFKIYNSLNEGGLVIFADLLGWRLDRAKAQKVLMTSNHVERLFADAGFRMLEKFDGVPYIESESMDQYTFYKEHFYIGRKESC